MEANLKLSHRLTVDYWNNELNTKLSSRSNFVTTETQAYCVLHNVRSSLPRSYFSRRATKLDTIRARWAEFRTPNCLISASHKYMSSSTPKKFEKLSVFRMGKPQIHQNYSFTIHTIFDFKEFKTYVYNVVDPIVPTIRQYPCDIVVVVVAQQWLGSLFCSGSKPKVENSMPCLNEKWNSTIIIKI